MSLFDGTVNWAQAILLLGISKAASGGTYCIGFLTQRVLLFGCQDFDPVTAFRVCPVHQAITQWE